MLCSKSNKEEFFSRVGSRDTLRWIGMSTGLWTLLPSHRSMGTVPHKAKSAASLWRSMGPASLYESIGDAFLHKSRCAAPVDFNAEQVPVKSRVKRTSDPHTAQTGLHPVSTQNARNSTSRLERSQQTDRRLCPNTLLVHTYSTSQTLHAQSLSSNKACVT